MPRHKVRRPWLDYLVYLAVRLVVAFAQMLSIEQSYALARAIAWLMYRVDARHRAVGLENLKMAYGDPVHRGRPRPDCPRRVSSLLHDDHGDVAHPAEDPPHKLADSMSAWWGTSRFSTGS